MPQKKLCAKTDCDRLQENNQEAIKTEKVATRLRHNDIIKEINDGRMTDGWIWTESRQI